MFRCNPTVKNISIRIGNFVANILFMGILVKYHIDAPLLNTRHTLFMILQAIALFGVKSILGRMVLLLADSSFTTSLASGGSSPSPVIFLDFLSDCAGVTV